MINEDEKNYIIDCFDKLIERNVITKEDISYSTLEEDEIISIENKYNITLPNLLKAYLLTYNYDFTDIYAGMVTDINDPDAPILEYNISIINLPKENTLQSVINNLEYAKKSKLLTKGFLPIAYFENNLGVICIDLYSDIENPLDYGIIYFDTDSMPKDFDNIQDDSYLESYKVLFSNFKDFLECTFMGTNDSLIDFNNKYSEDDELFDTLDKYHDNDEYENIIITLLKIPRSHYINKMYFRLISAYNNLKRYDTAKHYLSIIKSRCYTDKDKAKWHYMYGYIFYITEDDEKAKEQFTLASQLDPSDEDYSALALECDGYIKEKRRKSISHYKFIKLL